MFKRGNCPICQFETTLLNKSGLKIDNQYICKNCAFKLARQKIGVFNYKKYTLEHLKEILQQQDSNFTVSNNMSNPTNDPNLALNLFNTLSVGYCFDKTTQMKINKILQQCSSRQDILNKVITICGEPNTPQKRYIYAMTYGWSNKEYRKKAIHYITLYLNNELYQDIYIHKFKDINSSIDERKKEHIYDMQYMLIDLYIKEYEFDNAMELINKNISLIPQNPLSYRKKIEVLIKTDKINEAIIFLENFKRSKYYCTYKEYHPTTWMIDTINELLNECITKKTNNYVYKSRKQKIDYIQ